MLISTFFILTNCAGLSDAGKILRNEKINNTDEFLVKKKEPLTQPPDFDVLPTPGSETSKNEKTDEDLTKNSKISLTRKCGSKTKIHHLQKNLY